MKHLWHALTFALVLSSCGGNDDKPVGNDNPPDKNYDFTLLEQAAEEKLQKSNASALSIAVYKDGEVVFAQAYGTKTPEGQDTVDTDTLFQIGSTSKMLSAIATLRQVDTGLLTVSDKLVEALPGIQLTPEQEEHWGNITLHHLMTHQGGFIDYVDWDQTIEDPLVFAKNDYPLSQGLMNPPGKFFNYSNPNWSYLGAVLSTQLNKSFAAIMEEDIFIPLGMSNSTLRRSEVEAYGNYALGIGAIIENNQLAEGTASSLENIPYASFSLPAGSYTWSTPRDMLKVAALLMGDNIEILESDTLASLSQPHVDMQQPIEEYYGYGLFIDKGLPVDEDWYPIQVVHHGGDTAAYSSGFWVFPEQNLAISVLSNAGNDDLSEMPVKTLESLSLLPEPTEIPIKDVASDLFIKHVGTYQSASDPEIIAKINYEDNKLFIDVPYLTEAGINYSSELSPVGASMFLMTMDNEVLDLTFIPSEEGGASTYIRNREFVLIRQNTP